MTNGRDDHERVVTHSDLSLITGEVGSVSRVQLTVCVYVCVCVCVCVGGGGGCVQKTDATFCFYSDVHHICV